MELDCAFFFVSASKPQWIPNHQTAVRGGKDSWCEPRGPPSVISFIISCWTSSNGEEEASRLSISYIIIIIIIIIIIVITILVIIIIISYYYYLD